jgi:regulator of sigma E protease
MLLIGILTGLIILVILVVIHELGHAIVARRNGVVVEEFGVGFPPKAWAKKLKRSILGNDVLFSINWLPLGGFVKLQGEHDAADKKGDYGAATYWQKTRILLAGVLMNWAAAVVLFTILALVGLPKILPNPENLVMKR